MPAPLPAKVLLLHGRGNGKDSSGYQVPTPPAFERVAPEPPDFLDDEGRAEWDRVIADLEPLGLLKNSDRGTLVAYCEAWSRFVAAVKQYRSEGVVRVNPFLRSARQECSGECRRERRRADGEARRVVGSVAGRRTRAGIVHTTRR
jgi:phage terminase small subunit